MSAAEQWYCNRNFKGIDDDGKPRDYTRGEPIPNVENWPTFASLKNIDWIVAKPVPRSKAEPKAAVVDAKPAEEPTKKKTEAKKSKATSKAKTVKASKPKKEAVKSAQPEAQAQLFTCEVCGKEFTSSRALKVHMRYH